MPEAQAATKDTTTTGTAAAETTTGATTATDKGAAGTGAAAATTIVTKDAAATTDTGDGTATNDATKGYWPDDWQTRVSKGDEKRSKALGKFHSPEALADSYFALERRFSSGEYRPVLPKDPKPEEISAWRKDNGIPEKPEAYDIKDLKIPDTDKEIVGNFLKSAHEANMTPQQAKVSLSNYYQIQEQQAQARAQKDDEQRHAALDALNHEWGGSFRRNVNLIEGTILSRFPEDVRGLIKSARLPDGTALFNSVPALKALAGLALELNPAGIVAPASGGDLAKPALAEYKELQDFMRKNRTAYNKDSVKQDRMGQLIEYLRKQELIDESGNEISQKKKAA